MARAKDLRKRMLRDMALIRRFEEEAGRMYGLRKVGGFCHLYNGQEAVAVGAATALDLSKDYVLTGYRDHGHAIACGMDPKAIMAELFGKVTGSSRGKGGSMHLFDEKLHFLGGNGIVGGQIPVATGVAFAQKYQETGGVTVVFFGDGAIHQGAFHESLNMAKIWELPVIYACENNRFGMGTSWKRVSSITEYSVMGASYGIPGRSVDGMDVLAVHDAFSEAAASARAGLPVLLDVQTYRYKGHSMSDPQKYRTKEEVQAYHSQDPILNLTQRMEASKAITRKEIEAMEEEIEKIVAESVAFAEASPEPSASVLYEDVYASPYPLGSMEGR
ncbi:MAG: pyruvate dehydrogenase (acetyl-transferring) E1 component subunit alpha [Treponema sp. GWB1_62_6]|nr:MAG: pyruvate dehydrogenase (acetyl-transferring) E1 component subunit alpha [Treponema sp. GWA1_62_8]OHE63956.1 MAG: pyruvate dehydrogenase (acetyl-transferring) E1 component subunit alpha [Treponema sp. GWC1_61_84]OHE67249.1 MAG: pyruvate dehydrogenase (acetyl-transferring) E1 component subunit alpha [Treponema sp. GWB1_62_6]OHE76716.1 MAG: pyruvate dehydrogenase (acetyl-transferring) E1 component subunit alpha [Treponema sp. RIFOXYC1_FULL_61_9]HCM25279.1 pyruvate dehydrogenase (acetyl-tra